MHPYAMHAPPLGYQPLLTTTQQEIEHSLNSLQLKLQQRRMLHPASSAGTSEQLLRLQQLRREREAIASQQAMFSSLPHPGPILPPSTALPAIPAYELSYDEDELLRQYQDGTRAQLYYQDIAHRQPADPHLSGLPKATQAGRTDNWDTPYQMLSQTAQAQPQASPPKQSSKAHPLAKQLQPVFEQEQERPFTRSPSPGRQYSPLKPKPVTSRHPSPTRSNRGSSPIKLRRNSNNSRSVSGMRRHKSVGRVGVTTERVELHPAGGGQNQLTVLKLVENRLRVAQVAYEDPKYNRQQEEVRQLINTYQAEERQRNQLKGTLTKHPKVLQKYPFLL